MYMYFYMYTVHTVPCVYIPKLKKLSVRSIQQLCSTVFILHVNGDVGETRASRGQTEGHGDMFSYCL
jgi:hypothetical protein